MKELIFIALSLLISFATFYFYRFVDTCPSGAMCIVGGSYVRGFPVSMKTVIPVFGISDLFGNYYISAFIINTIIYFVVLNIGYFVYKKLFKQKIG